MFSSIHTTLPKLVELSQIGGRKPPAHLTLGSRDNINMNICMKRLKLAQDQESS